MDTIERHRDGLHRYLITMVVPAGKLPVEDLMRITSCFIAVAMMALVWPAMAAPCTPGQRADLAKLGYEQADINKMCGNASALFEMAYNAKESGDLRTAQQLFEQGLRIEPGNELGQKYLAEVKDALSSAQKLFEQAYNAKQSGDLRTARRLFEQGLSIEPGDALAQKYLAEVKEEAELLPGKVFKDCADCPEMVVIPAGDFQMGSNFHAALKPIHTVIIVKPFALAKTEVTQGQWRAVMGNNPSHNPYCGVNCPVENVNWNDAQEFVRKLSQKTGKTYRLPSEAEWEYTCRAGGTHAYCGSDSIDSVGWSGGLFINKIRPVAGKQANAWGLFDMSGNVWEWTEDCWNGSYSGAPNDGSAWTTGDCAWRVLRGGSGYVSEEYARSATRRRNVMPIRNDGDGLRLARMLP